MKWAVVTAFCCAVAFAWIQLSIDAPRMQRVSAASRRSSEVAQQISTSLVQIARELRLDTLRRMLPREPGLYMAFFGGFQPAATENLRDVVNDELSAVSPLRSRIGVFIVPGRLGYPVGRVWGSPSYPMAPIESYAGEDEHGPFCIVTANDNRPPTLLQQPQPVTPLDPWAWRGGAAQPLPSDVLGGCHYWARYGMPGARIRDWLRSSGNAFAADYVEKRPDAFERAAVARGPFGMTFSRYRYGTKLEMLCTLRNAAKCRSALVPDSVAYWHDLAGNVVWTRYSGYSWGMYGSTLLADAERKFGAERFARFWQSDADVRTAFHDAFGVTIEDWTMQWAEQRFGTTLEGPRMAGATVLLSLLGIAALLGAALAVARARQV